MTMGVKDKGVSQSQSQSLINEIDIEEGTKANKSQQEII